MQWLTPEDGLAGSAPTSLIEHDGRLWVGTLDGVSVLTESGLSPVASLEGFGVNALAVDGQDNLWMAGVQGLARRDGATGEVELVHQARGIRFQALSSILFDAEGSLWLTSMAGGLMQARPGAFAAIGRAGRLEHRARDDRPG